MRPDFTLVEVNLLYSSSHGFVLEWCTQSAGFGTTSFTEKTDGSIVCDNEAMGKQFVKRVLNKFLSECDSTKRPSLLARFTPDELISSAKPTCDWER